MLLAIRRRGLRLQAPVSSALPYRSAPPNFLTSPTVPIWSPVSGPPSKAVV